MLLKVFVLRDHFCCDKNGICGTRYENWKSFTDKFNLFFPSDQIIQNINFKIYNAIILVFVQVSGYD